MTALIQASFDLARRDEEFRARRPAVTWTWGAGRQGRPGRLSIPAGAGPSTSKPIAGT